MKFFSNKHACSKVVLLRYSMIAIHNFLWVNRLVLLHVKADCNYLTDHGKKEYMVFGQKSGYAIFICLTTLGSYNHSYNLSYFHNLQFLSNRSWAKAIIAWQ